MMKRGIPAALAVIVLCGLLDACGTDVPSGEKISTSSVTHSTVSGDVSSSSSTSSTASPVAQSASHTTKGEIHSAKLVVSSDDGFFDDEPETGSTTTAKLGTGASASAVTGSGNASASTTRMDGDSTTSSTSGTTQIPSIDENGVPWITVPLPTK